MQHDKSILSKAAFLPYPLWRVGGRCQQKLAQTPNQEVAPVRDELANTPADSAAAHGLSSGRSAREDNRHQVPSARRRPGGDDGTE